MATKLSLRIRRLGIDTYQETVVYMRHDCLVCQSEGFGAQTRIRISVGANSITSSMINHGDRLHWDAPLVVDKHCVGGLPGNRTSLIVVAIVASFGLMIPKTSSRAITSPAGTADTMEVLAPVTLTLPEIRRAVEKEGGCIVWGGGVSLSPADDLLIRVEGGLDLDSEGQLIASVTLMAEETPAIHLNNQGLQDDIII